MSDAAPISALEVPELRGRVRITHERGPPANYVHVRVTGPFSSVICPCGRGRQPPTARPCCPATPARGLPPASTSATAFAREPSAMSDPNQQWLAPRPAAPGKFLYAGEQKLWVKGVTYGTFRPGSDDALFPGPAVVRRDFAQISAAGFNAVRTYTAPPPWLLDVAADHGLRVLAGLWWPQHVTFLDAPRRARSIEATVRATMRQYADHPALLAVAIGNEIPAPIVRWHGAPAIEGQLRRLYDVVKDVDPGALVTYVNSPTTEYLDLPFLDFVSFNVYLEAPERLAAYLA